MALESPKLGVPLKNARWELFLPPDYDYSGFAGSMTHEADGTALVQVYSSAEYFKQEESKRVSKRGELLGFLSKTRSQLKQGSLSSANNEFNNAVRLNGTLEGEALQEIEVLRRDLNRSQSSNLIQAQRAYTADNAKKFAGKGAAADAPVDEVAQKIAAQVDYDADTAQQQWGALQRAQELTVARVEPLRANLPTRGVKHAFAQVLQTEVGRPMTVSFQASNAKETGWFQRVASFGGAFVLLWMLVALLARRQPVPSARAA